jgi:Mu-like prophage major head subunit gpT
MENPKDAQSAQTADAASSAETITTSATPPAPQGGSIEIFAMGDDATFVPSTVDKKNRTVDVVWYGGATVPRIDPNTGDKYNLRLDMNGCRMERLNAGAPFFDNHMSGVDYRSHSAGLPGSKAQLGSVQKAWTDGQKGMATVKFRDEGEDENADNMFNGIASGVFRNLSFGTTITNKKLESSHEVLGDTYVATDWEPYELSQANVPADYTTTFLTAEFTQPTGEKKTPAVASTTAEAPRATAQQEKPQVAEQQQTTTQDAGTQARTSNDVTLAAELAVKAERERVSSIRGMLSPFNFEAAFVNEMIDSGASIETAREKAMSKLQAKADQYTTRAEHASVTRDGKETQLACMEAALSKRANHQIFTNLPETEKRQKEEMARQYVGHSLIELARKSVELDGVNTQGMDRMRIATLALIPRNGHTETFGMGGAESTSDFPAVLANVANKTLRMAYEAFPQTFKPFSKPATAADFKPINRVQLNDLPSLPLLNEKGEYQRVNLNDSNATYSLGTYGGVVAITRKAIINDDLGAFTRTSASLGTASARTQSDVVWGLITANGNMADGNAVFSTAHKNKNTGTASSIDPTVNTGSNATLAALAAARKGLRIQKAPNGTPLNLVPKFLLAPAALETYALQLVYPIQLAASTVAGVIPEWISGLTPIIEPRLDAVSTTGWYFVADPATIDTVEYCFLEGQEGVYYETRQGFDVDGIEMKARMDFGAQVIEFRGLQLNAGA